MEEPWSAFGGRKYLNLETYRRDGSPVRTPVWFVESSDCLYTRTPENTGKLKRIRRNPRVRVAPCNMRGIVQGEWVEAKARFAGGAEAEGANRLLLQKYGIFRRLIDLRFWLRRLGHVVIAIER